MMYFIEISEDASESFVVDNAIYWYHQKEYRVQKSDIYPMEKQ